MNTPQITTEEDVKIKQVVPFLESLGYKKEDMQFENTDIEVFYRKKKTRISPAVPILKSLY